MLPDSTPTDPIPSNMPPALPLRRSIKIIQPPNWHSDYAMHSQPNTLAIKIANIGNTPVTSESTCFLAHL